MTRVFAALLAVLYLAEPVWARQPVRARNGMVVTEEPIAADVGVCGSEGGRQCRRCRGRGRLRAGGDVSGRGESSAAAASCLSALPTAAQRSSISASVRRGSRRATCIWIAGQADEGQHRGLARFRRSGHRARSRACAQEIRQEAMERTGEPAVRLAREGFPLRTDWLRRLDRRIAAVRVAIRNRRRSSARPTSLATRSSSRTLRARWSALQAIRTNSTKVRRRALAAEMAAMAA